MAIFGRFTQRAQRAVAAAQQAAVLLHQPYVGTEHILLGLLKEPGPVVADVLPADVNYDTVLERVRALLGEGNVQSGGMLELTPRSKKILESSILESRKLHHSFELMILQEVIVTSVTICNLLIHLCCSERCILLIMYALNPYRVRPL